MVTRSNASYNPENIICREGDIQENFVTPPCPFPLAQQQKSRILITGPSYRVVESNIIYRERNYTNIINTVWHRPLSLSYCTYGSYMVDTDLFRELKKTHIMPIISLRCAPNPLAHKLPRPISIYLKYPWYSSIEHYSLISKYLGHAEVGIMLPLLKKHKDRKNLSLSYLRGLYIVCEREQIAFMNK